MKKSSGNKLSPFLLFAERKIACAFFSFSFEFSLSFLYVDYFKRKRMTKKSDWTNGGNVSEKEDSQKWWMDGKWWETHPAFMVFVYNQIRRSSFDMWAFFFIHIFHRFSVSSFFLGEIFIFRSRCPYVCIFIFFFLENTHKQITSFFERIFLNFYFQFHFMCGYLLLSLRE